MHVHIIMLISRIQEISLVIKGSIALAPAETRAIRALTTCDISLYA